MTDIEKEVDQIRTESFILIKFEKLGDGKPQLFFNQVNAFQVMGTAAALETYGKNMFLHEQAQAEEERQRSQLAVPKSEILIGR